MRLISDNRKGTDMDYVTVLQVARGHAVMYKCRFSGSPNPFTFKGEPGIAPGSLAVVNLNPRNGNGFCFSLVQVEGEDEEWEPIEGVTYCWIVKTLDMVEISHLPNVDRRVRREIQRGEAIKAAEEALKGRDVQLWIEPAK